MVSRWQKSGSRLRSRGFKAGGAPRAEGCSLPWRQSGINARGGRYTCRPAVDPRAESMSEKDSRPWAGRFTEETDEFVARFTASVEFDRRLYAEDIDGSVAHARMLARCGVLTDPECEAIIGGLKEQGWLFKPASYFLEGN